jgi:Sulfotransferase domain
MNAAARKARRNRLLALLSFLPEGRRIRVERWLRGRDETRRLASADLVIVSFGKSGRTWLRVMLSRYYQLVHGIPEQILMGFSNYHQLQAEIPKILFTHDNFIKDYTGEVDSKAAFYQKKVVLLVRNPKDVAVSLYFQWLHRMRPEKMSLNGFPPQGAKISPYEFVMDPNRGLPKIIEFLNLWARESTRVGDILIVRYEDMRNDASGAFRRILVFAADGRPVDDAALEQAVDYASVENMRKLEESATFERSGGRMRPGTQGDPDSYKVRRAKVGGYKDYFSEAQTAEIDALVQRDLSPLYGYHDPAVPCPGAPDPV